MEELIWTIFIKSINISSKICIIIKIAKLNDEKHTKNSIITMIKIGKKTFKKIYKNKSPNLLYEKTRQMWIIIV